MGWTQSPTAGLSLLGLKTCTLCLEAKLPREFHRHVHTRDRRQSACKSCTNSRTKLRCRPQTAEHQERVRQAKRATAKRNEAIPDEKLRARDSMLRSAYGIGLAEYEEMFEKQSGRCAICNDPPADGKRLVVDHCHDTGKVRGLLCHTCNTGIGMLKDDVKRLFGAVRYLSAS